MAYDNYVLNINIPLVGAIIETTGIEGSVGLTHKLITTLDNFKC